MRLTGKDNRKWRFYIRRIREQFPPPCPTRVRTRKLKKLFGTAEVRFDHFSRPEEIFIEIDNFYGLPIRVDTLIHEWAHIMDRTAHHWRRITRGGW